MELKEYYPWSFDSQDSRSQMISNHQASTPTSATIPDGVINKPAVNSYKKHIPAVTMATFTEETTIHGIKELSRTTFWPGRYLWLAIILGCICGVSFEIYQVVTYFNSNPSASNVKWVVQPTYDYPPMIFCPKTFLNVEKVRKLNISSMALAYTVSLFQEVSWPYDQDGLDQARLETTGIMSRHNLSKYIDLFAAISFDTKDVLRDAISGEPLNLNLYIPGYGLCYQLHLAPVKATKVRSVQHVEIKYHPLNTSSDYDFVYGTSLLVRDFSGVKADMILLTKNAFYQIDFEVQVHKRMSRPNAKCFQHSELAGSNYYIADCEVNCIENESYSSGCKRCLPYNIIDQQNSHDTNWPCPNFGHSFNPDADNVSLISENTTTNSRPDDWCSQDAIANRSSACLKVCLPVCEQWIYKHSTLQFDYYKEGIHLRFLYNPSDGILTYEEVPTYTFDTFISNIGGQLGLWLGASVVSLIQILYYACLALTSSIKKKL